MAASTIYDIKVAYDLTDRASAGLKRIGDEAARADKSTTSLTSTLRGLATGALAVGAFSLGKKMFIDFNAEVENQTLGLATIINHNLGGGFAGAQKQAESLFDVYQEAAKKSTATTKDFLAMSRAIASPIFQAGLGMKDLEEFTIGAVVAVKAFNEDAELAARDIEQALAGTLSKKDRFARALLAPLGMDTEQWNRLKIEKRAALLRQMLTADSIKSAAKAQENSFSGVFSTLQDNLQIFLGKIGKPLFAAITAELKSWNDWIAKNPMKLQEIGEKFSSALMAGVDMVKRVVNMLVEHAPLIEMLAGLWIGKQVVTGGVGFFGSLVESAKGLNGSFVTMMSSTGNLISAFATLYTALKIFAEFLDNRHKSSITKGSNLATIREDARALGAVGTEGLMDFSSMNERTAIHFITLAKEWNAFTSQATLNLDKYNAKLLEMGASQEEAIMLTNLASDAFRKFDVMRRYQLLGLALPGFALRNRGNAAEVDPDKKKQKGPGTVNVNIHKIEIAADDPDRFAFGLEEAISNAIKNPTQPFHADRGGG